jgi:hypothetical protein
MYNRLERSGLTNGSKGVVQKSGMTISANVLGVHNSANADIGFQV